MRIGIYFAASKGQGGVYQYCVSFLESLNRIAGNKYIVMDTSGGVPDKFKKIKSFEIVDMTDSLPMWLKGISLLDPVVYKICFTLNIRWIITKWLQLLNFPLINNVNNQNLDLCFYLSSTDICYLAKPPFVVTVYDLEHKLKPEFKEVSAGGNWEKREFTFTNIAKFAHRSLVDSEIGKTDFVNLYHADPSKVVILKYLTGAYLVKKPTKLQLNKIRTKYKLPDDYILYPARFWPHKNHKNLIYAIEAAKNRGVDVNLVLTGSKDAEFTTFSEIQFLIKSLGLEKDVKYLGYVNDLELSCLYKQAEALVMPTFFGPTNIPVYEAWFMGIPVLYSNIRGCREQLGNAGLLIDPNNPEDIGDKIIKIYKNKKVRDSLIKKGTERFNEWSEKNFRNTIQKIIEEFVI